MKKGTKIFLLIVAGWFATMLVYGTIVLLLFNRVYNDPMDATARTYIYTECPELSEEYGEINNILRNTKYKKQKSDTTTVAAYTLVTDTNDVVVYVTLEKSGEEWKALSYEVLEVRPLN